MFPKAIKILLFKHFGLSYADYKIRFVEGIILELCNVTHLEILFFDEETYLCYLFIFGIFVFDFCLLFNIVTIGIKE